MSLVTNALRIRRLSYGGRLNSLRNRNFGDCCGNPKPMSRFKKILLISFVAVACGGAVTHALNVSMGKCLGGEFCPYTSYGGKYNSNKPEE